MMATCHKVAGKMELTLNLTCLEHVKWLEANDSLGMNGFISSQKSEGQVWGPHLHLCFIFFPGNSTSLNFSFPLQPSIYLFLFTSDLFIFQFLRINLLFHFAVNTSSQVCYTSDLLLSFFLHFSNISPGLLLILAVIQLVSGPVRQPVELICLFRS